MRTAKRMRLISGREWWERLILFLALGSLCLLALWANQAFGGEVQEIGRDQIVEEFPIPAYLSRQDWESLKETAKIRFSELFRELRRRGCLLADAHGGPTKNESVFRIVLTCKKWKVKIALGFPGRLG